MFRHQVCHPQGACLGTLLNYISTIGILVKSSKVFKTLKLSSVIKWLLLHEVCVSMLLLCLPGTLVELQIIKDARYMY